MTGRLGSKQHNSQYHRRKTTTQKTHGAMNPAPKPRHFGWCELAPRRNLQTSTASALPGAAQPIEASNKHTGRVQRRAHRMSTNVNTIRDLAEREYKWGFVSDIESESVPKGLNEETIRLISAKKQEPEFMLEWRVKAYRHGASLGQAQAEPKWANIHYGPIDYQDIIYYSAPKQKP